MTRVLILSLLLVPLLPQDGRAAQAATGPNVVVRVVPQALTRPDTPIRVKNNKKKKNKKPHVSGSVGTNGGKVKVGTGTASVGVNSNGKASVSVKPKGSNIRVGVNSKGRVRIGF